MGAPVVSDVGRVAEIQNLLRERYKHIIDLSDCDKNRLLTLSARFKAATDADDPLLLKRAISEHIAKNLGALIMLKIPTLPLPSREEIYVHKFMDGCTFKSLISCFGGNLVVRLYYIQALCWVVCLDYSLRVLIH